MLMSDSLWKRLMGVTAVGLMTMAWCGVAVMMTVWWWR